MYGVTLIQVELMLAQQNHLCAICHKPETQLDRWGNLRRLSVDHDHLKKRGEPGHIRGLLCGSCDFRVAAVDKPVWRSQAETYLALPAPSLTPYTREEWLASSRTYRDHGITEKQYAELLGACNGLCQICARPPAPRGGRPGRLVIDHDHTRQKGDPEYVRGLLDARCNTALGVLEDREWLAIADAYLKERAEYLPPRSPS